MIHVYKCTCSDRYKEHLKSQHPKKWKQYQANLNPSAHKKYFETNTPYANTLNATFGLQETEEKRIDIDKDIVDVLVAELLLDLDDDDHNIDKDEQLKCKKLTYLLCDDADK